MVGECETTKKRVVFLTTCLVDEFCFKDIPVAGVELPRKWVKTEIHKIKKFKSVTKVMQIDIQTLQIHLYSNQNWFYLFGFLCLTMNDFYFRLGIHRNLLLWGGGRDRYLWTISGSLGRSWSFRRSGPGRFWRSLSSTLNQRIKIINGSSCCRSQAILFRHWANKDFLDCFYFHLRRSLGHRFGSCRCGPWWRWALWSRLLTVFPFMAFNFWKGSKG